MIRDVRRAPGRALGYSMLTSVFLLTVGCGEEPTSSCSLAGEAQIRFVNAAHTAAVVDVRWAGDEAFTDVAYGEAGAAGQYKVLPAGCPVVRVFANATNTELSFGTFFAGADKRYTLALVRNGQSYTVASLADTAATPAAGKAKLRVVHFSLLAESSLDVYVTASGADIAAATPTAAGVQLRAATTYVELPAGSYRVRVTRSGEKTVLLDTGAIELADGTIRTVFALDPGTDAFPLRQLSVADN